MSNKNQHYKLLVDGYFRKCQALLPRDRIIPTSINMICFQYLSLTFWYFKNDSNRIWCLYSEEDQNKLTEAINDEKQECMVGLNKKTKVIFSDYFHGKEENSDIEVINGPPELYSPCIIENGSGFIKAGLCTTTADSVPSIIIPSVIADDTDNLSFKYPIKFGVVDDWGDMGAIWRHIFDNELNIKPEDHAMLMTETPLNPKRNREKMTQIMFEIFKVPGFYVTADAVLSLYASGRTTGIVLDSGHCVTHSVPIYEGYPMPHAIQKIDFGGKHISEYFIKLAKEKGCSAEINDTKIIHDIKEKMCCIAFDYDETTDLEQKYVLPDGEMITFGNELFCAPEVLFKPYLIGLENEGIDKLLYSSIMKCDHDRLEYYHNVILCGGNTRFKGLKNRVQKELKALAPSTMKVNVNVAFKYSCWMGGNILASLSTFAQMWITAHDYNEAGPTIVHRKCF